MTPEELNDTSDETLAAFVLGTMGALQPLAPFLTLEILRRVHELVVQHKAAAAQQGDRTESKHKLLARAVLRLTGVQCPPDSRDVDKIGNHLDVWLRRQYIEVDRKLVRNVRSAESRKRQRDALRRRCCMVTGWGGVQEFAHVQVEETEAGWEVDMPLPLGTPGSSSRRAPYVPPTATKLPSPLSMLELKDQVNEARDCAITVLSELRREKERADNAMRRCESAELEASSAQKKARQAMEEVVEVQRQTVRDLQLQKDLQDAQHRRSQLESAKALSEAQARVLILGGQVARATHEAGIHAQKEELALLQLEKERNQAEAESELLKAEISAMRKEASQDIKDFRCKLTKAVEVAEAKVLRLGSKVTAAYQEAGLHARREQAALLQLEEEHAGAEAKVADLQTQAATEREKHKNVERELARQVACANGKLLFLGDHVARKESEAGLHAQKELEALTKEKDALNELDAVRKERDFFQARATAEAELRRNMAKQCTAALAARDAAKETSGKRLEERKKLSEEVHELRSLRDELREELEDIRAQRDANANAAEKLKVMPNWEPVRSGRGKRGGGLKLEHAHRLAILEQHANGTPPSAIGKNILSVVGKAAPWLTPVETSATEIRRIGFELPTLEEALAARRTAAAYRVRLLGFDETTDRQAPVLTSNVQVQDVEGGELHDVVLKAAYLSTKGGTSEAIVSEIEDRCFARLRDLLRQWKKYHAKLFPDVDWTGPDPARCSLHRLAGGGALMSDTCNAARKAKRVMSDVIRKQTEAFFVNEYGQEQWESLSAESREEKLTVYILDCQQHLRNIWLGHMSRKQAAHVQQELSEQLNMFASWERMTTEYDQLLRAVYKEFHSGGLYYKGKGADFASWMVEHHADAFFMHIERAEGGRQDLDYDAAVPIYINRCYLVEYLHALVYRCEHKNILEDFLYQALMSTQFIAMSRANAIIDLRVSRPHRWLAGKTSQLTNWSPIRMNGVLDLIDVAFQNARDDGTTLLDPALDIFAPIAESQPLFRAYREFTYEVDAVLSPNGKVRHLHYKQALAELLDPTDATNKLTYDKTVEYLQVQASAALEKMYDPKLAIADKLTSQQGENSIGKQGTADVALRGCHATNDATAESVFGAWKLERRRLTGISVRRSSGLAQARISKSLSHKDAVRHRRSKLNATALSVKKCKRKSAGMFAYFHQLPYTEQVALVEMCRAEREEQRKLDREDWAELDGLRAATRKSNSEVELEALIKNFALALSFYDRYVQRAAKSMREVELSLQGLATDQLRLDWLREQLEMRTIGLGWVEFKTQWSSGRDGSVGTISDLSQRLAEVLEEELEREIPIAAPAPIMRRKTFKALGTPTAQAQLLSDQRLSHSIEELLAAARKKREELEAQGELDTTGDRQPRKPPSLNQDLVGRKLEIRWRYWREALPGEKGTKKQVFIWCEGTVEEVSHGTIKKSKRSKDSIPAGAVRIRWPADADHDEKETLAWSILNPDDWCREVHLGWRWAPCELEHMAAPAATRGN